jgi:methyl-accepting chemotaxis protein
LLFLLLKVRMEPLLALRTTVSRLAKGVMDLSPRAGVKTDDEFGELALDLNHFLDRIGVVVVDLDKILSEVVSVGGRLGTLNRQLEKQLDGMRDSALRTLGDGAQRGLETQLVAARESGAFDVLAETLDTLAASGQVPAPTAVPLRDQVTRLRDSFSRVTQALQQASPPILVAQAQSAEYQAFALSLREMAVLEATMQTVAESGQRLLQRISKGKNGSVD